MRLISSDGNGVELGVAGYQFPDATHPGQRQGWLIVEGSAHCPEGTWSFRWQALTADEAVELADWLRKAPGRAPFEGRDGISLGFTEPNLAFTARSADPNEIELQVSLDLEFAPPWSQRILAGTPFTISFQVTPEAMMRAADEWTAAIAPFPPWNRDGLQ